MSDKKYIAKLGLASCGIASGASPVWDELNNYAKNGNLIPKRVGCLGMCYKEPMLEIIDPDCNSFTYGEVDVKTLKKIFSEHIEKGKPVEDKLVLSSFKKTSESPYYTKQVKIVTRNSGHIDPESIADYISADGYKAFEKALKEMTPESVISEIKNSGLRGRGGAGFSTGLKWELARASEDEQKYIICNADEGDPGAFMDRNLLESDPHSVIEGMLIGAYAIGCSDGFFYVRAEYPLAVKRLHLAIQQATEKNLLGDNILGTDFSFRLHIREGAGAFVCGEETALMRSVEGKRGMPTLRPPFPAVKGLWDKPTNINNVETYGNIAWIILNGAEKFASYGTEKSKGTKVFALAGKTVRTGTVEVPMGITIREVVFDIAGGIRGNNEFKAVQLGGPSGGCLPENLADTPIDYESLVSHGAIMGSGGLIVMDTDTCMVDVARYFLDFTQSESCGKCTFCRVGTKRMLEILERICDGKGKTEDIDILKELGELIKVGSLCGLGQTAPNPVLTTLHYYKDEYESHIVDKKCPAHSCKALVTYTIITDKCTGCTLCARNCPTSAISGEPKKVHIIDQSKCIKCSACYDVCKFEAIDRK